jgi:hypothetical protein
MAAISIISIIYQRRQVSLTQKQLEAARVSYIIKFLLIHLQNRIMELSANRRQLQNIYEDFEISKFAKRICELADVPEREKPNPDSLVDSFQGILEKVGAKKLYENLKNNCKELNDVIKSFNSKLKMIEEKIKTYIENTNMFHRYFYQIPDKDKQYYPTIEIFQRALGINFLENWNLKENGSGLSGAWCLIQEVTSRKEAYEVLEKIAMESSVKMLIEDCIALSKEINDKASGINKTLGNIVRKIKCEYPSLTDADFNPIPLRIS